MSKLPDPRRVPAAVLDVLRGLQANGKQAYLAGGAVRDLVRLARWEEDCARSPSAWAREPSAPQDFDVATDALPEQVIKLFARVIPTGLAHGTVMVLAHDGAGEHKIEVTTFRGEGPYLDGRRPSEVTFLGDLRGDLARRDFTVNALAWNPLSPAEEGIVDPFGGLVDLERCVLRAVGDPVVRFTEDGLRPLRAVRFATTLRLAIEPKTLRAIRQTLDTFDKVSQERVHDELVKLLVRGAPPARGLRLLARTGLLSRIVPELMEGVGFPQNRWHAWDVWRHTLRCVDASPPELVSRLAALLHDVAKPRTAAPKEGASGEYSFYGHEVEGAGLAAQILSRLRFSVREIEAVALLVREHNWHYLPEWTDATCRRVIARVGPSDLPALWALRRADLLAHGRRVGEGLANLAALEERFGGLLLASTALRVKDLSLSGREVMQALGIAPGPRVGQALKWLLDRVLDDPSLNTRESLLGLLSELPPALSTGNSQA